MYKINIRDDRKIVKQKIYQTEKSYKLWKPKMIAQYSRVYSLEYFEFKDGEWVKI